MIPEGKYKASAVDAVISEPKDSGKSPSAVVLFQTKDGDAVQWRGYFSDTVISAGVHEGKTVAQVTIDTLRRLGWDGNFENMASIVERAREVTVVVEHSTIEQGPRAGETFARVKYINSGPPPASAATTKGLASKYKAAVLATGGVAKAPPAARQAPAPSYNEDAEDPF